MKATKNQIKKANACLLSRNLELIDHNGFVNCFCINTKATDIEIDNMNIIRDEIRTAKNIDDITWMHYFNKY